MNMDFIGISILDAEKMVLVLARVSAILFMFPVFDNRTLPVTVKVGLSLVISLILFPWVELKTPVLSAWMMGAMVIQEIVVGAVLALAVNMVFGAVQLAGQVVGFQMGLGIASVIDPFTSARTSVVTQFYDLIAILLFFAFNAHHMVIRALETSFRVIPFGGVNPSEPLLRMILDLSGAMFLLALQIGVPVLAVNFFVSVGLGLLARTVPQMNVFIVGFPLKIAVGLMAVGISVSFLSVLLRHVFVETDRHLTALIRAF